MHDDNLLPLFLSLTVVITAFAVTMTVLLLVFKQRQVAARLQRQQLEFQYREDLLRTQVEIQEQALGAFSQEIHDSIGLSLSMGRVQFATLREHINSHEGTTVLNDALEEMQRNIKHLRLVSHSLNTRLVQHEGLEMCLRNETERLEAFTKLRCSLNATGKNRELTPDMDLLLFRIAQEALQNVLKHAEATTVVVSLHYGDLELTMHVADDGKGMVENADGKTSLGMNSMKQRAAMLGGTLTVRPVAPSGTDVCVSAPYQAP